MADIGSFTFRAERPFHPERLMGFVMEHLPSVLRSKVRRGLWVSTNYMQSTYLWSTAVRLCLVFARGVLALLYA